MEQQQYLKLFGQHVKEIRLNKNLSIKQVSQICSVTEQEVIQIENGEIDSQILLIKKLAEVLNVELHELFSFDFKR